MLNSIVLMGFHAGTTPSKYPEVLTEISNIFRKKGFEIVFWIIDDETSNLSINYKLSDFLGLQQDLPSLTEEERSKWIQRCINRGFTDNYARLTIQSTERYSASILKILQPCIYIGWNNLTFSFGIFADLARKSGVKAYSIEAGAILQSWRFEDFNFAQGIEYPDFDLKYANIGKQLLKRSKVANSSIYKQDTNNKDLELINSQKRVGKRIILVLGTLEGDSGATEGGDEKNLILPEFEDSYSVAAQAAINSDDFIVFKPHPLSVEKYDKHKLYNDKVFISKTDPLQLIDSADIVINIFGKLSIALLQLHKKTIHIGIGFFYGLEIGKMANSKKELFELLSSDFEYDSQKYLTNLEFALGYLYSTRWYLFPNSGIEIPEGCLTTEQFVDNIVQTVENKTEPVYDTKYIVDLINSHAKVESELFYEKNNQSLKKALMLVLNFKLWFKIIKNLIRK